MDRVVHVKPDFPADAFAGTASYYLQYRVPYPEELMQGLIDRSNTAGDGRLLDLACGPGRVALALVPSFREIWAIDAEPEMIETGEREAARRGVGNIKWIVGRAETLEAPSAAFDLVTVGEAFHRLDQQIVATRSLQWLKAGGHLAILGSYSILSGGEEWQRLTVEIVRRWTRRPSGPKGSSEPRKPGSGPDHDERVLKEAGFSDVVSCPYVKAHDWTVESILGYLYSTSACSKNLLGSGAGKFEADLRAALHLHDPSGVYRENTRWGFTIGRKPDEGV